MDRVPPVRIPAAARSTLVGNGALLQFYGEVARQRALTLVIGGIFEHAHRYRRVDRGTDR